MVTTMLSPPAGAKESSFLKDGQIFHELVRSGQDRRQFLNEILDVLALTGGELLIMLIKLSLRNAKRTWRDYLVFLSLCF